MEVKSKVQCLYAKHYCTRSRYRDYDFCFRHILEDRSSPFLKCQHISKVTQRRCQNPAPKPERNSSVSLALCDHHKFIKTQNNKRKVKNRKHIFSKEQPRNTLDKKAAKALEKYSGNSEINLNLHIDHSDSEECPIHKNEKWIVSNSSSWNTGEPDMDLEMLNENENVLQQAEIYTEEEIVTLSRDNLVQLQSLYIDQFKQLHQDLVENRRQYLTTIQTLGVAPVISDPTDEEKALLSFRRCFGEERLLAKRQHKKRVALSKGEHSSPRFDAHSLKTRCSHVNNHTRCKASCLPYTKYCVTHILDDPLQVLYKKCFYSDCFTPVCLLSNTITKQVENQDKLKPLNELPVFCDLHQSLHPTNNNIEAVLTKAHHIYDKIISQPHAVKKEAIDEDLVSDVEILEVDGVGKAEPNNADELFNLSDPMQQISPSNLTNDNVVEEPSTIEYETSPLKEEACPEITLNVVPKTAPSSLCNLDDLQSGQCYVMSDITDKENVSLHLQPLTGISSSGEAELGQSIVLKASVPETTSKIKIDIPDVESSKVALLDLKDDTCEKDAAMVEHNGAVISISRKTADSPNKATSGFVHTIVPPIEDSTPVDESEKNEGLAKPVVSMPPLAPLQSQDQLRKASMTDATACDKPITDGLNVNIDENKIPVVKTPFPENLETSDLKEETFQDTNSDEPMNVRTTDRKPCPDEETAVASLLSLCSAAPYHGNSS